MKLVINLSDDIGFIAKDLKKYIDEKIELIVHKTYADINDECIDLFGDEFGLSFPFLCSQHELINTLNEYIDICDSRAKEVDSFKLRIQSTIRKVEQMDLSKCKVYVINDE